MTRGTTRLTWNGLSVTLNMPKATESKRDARGTEVASALAPSRPVTVYAVDDYPDCPAEWLRSNPEINLRTYFFALEIGHMVWFDFNACDRYPNHVAVLISSQGVNALSGRPVTFPVHLEQYKRRCPNHDIPFTANRYCAECRAAWPGQNYLASNVTPYGYFWHDGFRDKDGKTSEFVFTENFAEGVAAQVIGEDRVDAFSLAFYVSKEPKPVTRGGPRGGYLGGGFEESFAMDAPKTLGSGTRGLRSAAPRVEIGKGAMVEQVVHDDSQPLEYWQEQPTALIRIYYCRPVELAAIVGGNRAHESAATQQGGSLFGGIPKGNKTF